MQYFFFVLGWLMSIIPGRLIEAFAWFLAVILFDFLRIRRKTVLSNLDTAFKDEYTKNEKISLGRQSVYHFMLTICEFLVSVRLKIDGDVEHVGRGKLDAALAAKRGVYILCCHLGNWEAMGASFSNEITNSYILVKKVGKGGLSDFVVKLRDKNNFLSVKREKKGDGLKAIKEILSRNEIVGFVFDQSRPGEPRLPFFGVEAKTNTSLAAIWQKFQAPIVPSYIERVSFGCHKLHFLDQLEVPVTGDLESDVISQSSYYNKIVEQMIRACPEQYFWMHKRWK